ncbi:thiamine phosphate synthase [Legionella dresdenensis]|uniref:Thiamine-phosphate synthase n=1 Tax=Legionella dresdenensis TaxID=450200 RepID=A0ABV8CEH9_9GAMM
MDTDYLKLMLVTNRQTDDLGSYLAFIEQCLIGGVTSVQLREKSPRSEQLLADAGQLKLLLDRYQIPLIINDNVDLAIELDAAGVHLGQSDGCPETARARLGQDKIIGLSLESEEDLLTSNQLPVSYTAASAVFATASKSNLRKLWGLAGLRELAERCRHPVIAIGGIDLTNAADVAAAGAAGIAVIGALHQADDPAVAASRLCRSFEGGAHAYR